MFRNRLLNVLIVVALIAVVALTVREVSATSLVVSRQASACTSMPSPYAIHMEVVGNTGTRLPYTEDGPAGVDGGLIYLLSAYQHCSG